MKTKTEKRNWLLKTENQTESNRSWKFETYPALPVA